MPTNPNSSDSTRIEPVQFIVAGHLDWKGSGADLEICLSSNSGADGFRKVKVDPDLSFRFNFTSLDLEDYFSRNPGLKTLFFQVQHKGSLIADTRETLTWDPQSPVARRGDPFVIPVNLPERTFRIEGKIFENGQPTPKAKLVVRAANAGLREDSILAEARVGKDGTYQLSFSSVTLRERQESPDLLVKVFKQGREESPLAESVLRFGIREHEIIDLFLDDQPIRRAPDFERTTAALQPLLTGSEPDSLGRTQIALLAKQSGLSQREVLLYAHSLRHSKETDIEAQTFYALLERLPTDLLQLLRAGREQWRNALEKSAAKGRVDASEAETLDATLDALENQTVEKALDRSGQRSALAEVMEVSGLPAARQNSFLRRWLRNEEPPPQFWETMVSDRVMTRKQIRSLQLSLQLLAITFHIPMVRALRSRDDVRDGRDLARLTPKEWSDLIKAQGVPPGISGRGTVEKRQNYQELIFRVVEDAFPTGSLFHRLSRDSGLDTSDLERFYLNVPDAELLRNAPARILAENPRALEGIDDEERLHRDLDGMAAILRLAPPSARTAAVRTLYFEEGLASSIAIQRLGLPRLLRMSDRLGGDAAAHSLYDRALQTSSMTLMLLAKYSPQFNQGFPGGIPASMFDYQANMPDLPPEGLPDFATLFPGGLDFCECEHCRSVLSPAAYLVDLLQFTGKALDEEGSTGLELLRQRRSDLDNILLSCENTNTLLPHIDLATEILERVVERDDVELGEGSIPQTDSSANELRLYPEHTRIAAYEILAQANYPWILPFDLPAAEADAYLKTLGLADADLLGMRSPEPGAAEELAWATRYLGLTPAQRDLITGSDPTPVHRLYGFAFVGTFQSALLDPDTPNISTLLERSGLDLLQLEKLLQSRFVNPEGEAIEYAQGSCDPDTAHIELTADDFLRLVRFWRLLQAAGMSVSELDRVLARLSGLGDPVILLLARIRKIRGRFPTLASEALLAWWSPISTLGHDEEPSPYFRLFLNPVTFPDPGDRAVFALNAAGDELAETGPSLLNPDGTLNEEIAALVSAGLGIRGDRLRDLLPELSEATLNLENLSHLYRLDTLLRGLGITLAEFQTLRALNGLSPFADSAETGSQSTVLFLDQWESLKDSGVGLDLADGLLRHRGEALLGEDAVRSALSELRAELLAIHDQNPTEGISEPDEIEEINLLVRQLSENAILEHLSRNLAMETAMIAMLLQTLRHPDQAEQSALEAFFDGEFLAPDLDLEALEAYPTLRRTLWHLHKIGALAKAGKLSLQDLEILLDPETEFDWFDLAALPFEPLDVPAPGQWPAFLHLLTAVRLARFFPSETSFFQFLSADRATVDEALQELADLVPWNLEDLHFLAGPQALNLTLSDTRNAEWLERIEAVLETARRAAASAARIWNWADLDGSFADRLARARDIRHAARAKLGDSLWAKAAEPAGQDLRAARRDALQGFVIARFSAFSTPFDLYQRYLIDTEINPCFMTSRIKQAIASVQLFIQRIWLSMEGTLRFPLEAQNEVWEWMKNYRVWEANRKVFLYPENWLQSDFLDRKTPFFKELESELLQDAMTLENTERAYRNYLAKLDGVARLEMAGMYAEGARLHVFARTKGEPPQYFYRVREAGGVWSAWESVDADIEGNHLVPVVHNHRVTIIWPVFEREVDEFDVDPDDKNPPTPPAHYNIKLRWSRLENGSWTPAVTSKQSVSTKCKINAAKAGTRHFYFWARSIPNGDLEVYPTFFADTFCPNTILLNYFRFTGCTDEPEVVGNPPIKIPYRVPFASRNDFMKFSAPASRDLTMFVDAQISPQGTIEYGQASMAWLLNPPTGFRVLPPHQFAWYVNATAPFFYEDRDRVFVVDPMPNGLPSPSGGYSGSIAAANINPGTLPAVSYHYLVGNANAAPLEPSIPGMAMDGLNQVVANCYENVALAVSGLVNEAYCIPPVGIAPPPSGPQVAFASLASLMETSLGPLPAEPIKRFRMAPFYHPFVCDFVSQVNNKGLFGLLQPGPEDPLFRQAMSDHSFQFSTVYQIGNMNQNALLSPVPAERVDFSYLGAYSQYNWELFFHIPMLMADRLKQEQRFEEAQRWMHTVFNPTCPAGEGAGKYWMLKPFFEFSGTSSLLEIMRLINEGDPEFVLQVWAWRFDAFNPHGIARMRPVAYMKAVVMQYIDLLIAWADSLFRRDTIESVQEAAQLYVIVALLLGEKPRVATAREPLSRTFSQIEVSLDAFSNSLVQLELHFLAIPWDSGIPGPGPDSLVGFNGDIPPVPPPHPGSFTLGPAPAPVGGPTGLSVLPIPPDPPPPFNPTGLTTAPPDVVEPLQSVLYFCVPPNEKLLGYWDLVSDRLFKIRNCMDLQGRLRTLPLFEPPIDPALLIQAKLAGLDLASVLNDLALPLPPYRFNLAVSKALEFCGEVQNLGNLLLSELEKKDAESMALLRAAQEERLADELIGLRQKSIDEAESQIDVLQETQRLSNLRFGHYQGLIQDGDSDFEIDQRKTMEDGKKKLDKSWKRDYAAAILHAVPGFDFNFGYALEKGGKMGKYLNTTLVSYGSTQVAAALTASASKFRNDARKKDHEANKASFENTLYRREQDWTLQRDSAKQELAQIDKQITAARIRVEMAKMELRHQELQLKHSRETDAFLKGKYTNKELYAYLREQVSALYFQSYQLAYEMARRAERCYRHELGIPDETERLVQHGHWDSLRKGLLAGEKLHRQLNRLQVAYLEQNRRELELTKHISLAMLNPIALLELKEEGICEMEIPEALFDLDYPGHYFRRIKSVTITIPAVTGPYTTLSCTLRLLRSSIRRQTTLPSGQYARDLENDDPRFSDSFGSIQSIATSRGQNDSGLFEFSFRDERYLPCEGAGAISRWQLQMPNEFRQFDYDSISDVVLHINYTAREGGDVLGDAAEEHLLAGINALVTGADAPGLHQPFSARHEFPTEFHRLLHPAGEAEPQILAINLAQNRFPYMFQGRNIGVDQVHIFVRLADEIENPDAAGTEFTLFHPGGEEPVDLGAAASFGNVLQASIGNLNSGPGEWSLSVSSVGDGLADESSQLNPNAIADITFILHYTIE